jgi:gentisate 1,2-dioxygenase
MCNPRSVDTRVRMRGPKPGTTRERSYWGYMDRMKRLVARERGCVVVRGAERAFAVSPIGRLKDYINAELDTDTAVNQWFVFSHEVRTQSGAHRHQGGLLLYCLSGRGYTTLNDTRAEYEAGDLLLMPILPGGVHHQHFNADPGGPPCRWIAFLFTGFRDAMGTQSIDTAYSPEYRGPQHEALGAAAPSPGAARRVAAAGGAPAGPATPDLMTALLEIRDRQRARHANGLVVVKGGDLPWETNRHGRMRWYLHPAIETTSLHNHLFFEQEIPPGGRTGRQRKQGNEIMYVTAGRGYTVLDGVRHDWEEDDVLCFPVRLEGNVVQHFNSRRDRPARFVSCQPYIEGLGVDLGAGLEQIEDAPFGATADAHRRRNR